MVLLDEPSTGMDPQSKRFLWYEFSYMDFGFDIFRNVGWEYSFYGLILSLFVIQT